MPALRVHQVDSRVNELSGIIDLFETYMDEDSTLPRYMTGSNPTDGAAATMGGLSMLMSASSIVLGFGGQLRRRRHAAVHDRFVPLEHGAYRRSGHQG